MNRASSVAMSDGVAWARVCGPCLGCELPEGGPISMPWNIGVTAIGVIFCPPRCIMRPVVTPRRLLGAGAVVRVALGGAGCLIGMAFFLPKLGVCQLFVCGKSRR